MGPFANNNLLSGQQRVREQTPLRPSVSHDGQLQSNPGLPTTVKVPTMVSARISDDIAAAIAEFFYRGKGPSHRAISRCLTSAGLSDGYNYTPNEPGPNKQDRIFIAFQKRGGNKRRLLDCLLSALRHEGLIANPTGQQSTEEQQLRLALGRSGWLLTDEGNLQTFTGADFDTGGRKALEENLKRLRNSEADPALMIGTAKDLLESIAKFVLEEVGYPVPKNPNFNQLLHIAREALGVLPERVDKELPGYKEIRAIYESLWNIAKNVNELRKLQGTGHGRTLPTGVPEDIAIFVAREACSVGEFMLQRLNQYTGG